MQPRQRENHKRLRRRFKGNNVVWTDDVDVQLHLVHKFGANHNNRLTLEVRCTMKLLHCFCDHWKITI